MTLTLFNIHHFSQLSFPQTLKSCTKTPHTPPIRNLLIFLTFKLPNPNFHRSKIWVLPLHLIFEEQNLSFSSDFLKIMHKNNIKYNFLFFSLIFEHIYQIHLHVPLILNPNNNQQQRASCLIWIRKSAITLFLGLQYHTLLVLRLDYYTSLFTFSLKLLLKFSNTGTIFFPSNFLIFEPIQNLICSVLSPQTGGNSRVPPSSFPELDPIQQQ